MHHSNIHFNHVFVLFSGEILTNFNKWFPKMIHLRLYRNLFTDPKCIETHFPYLQQLEICNREQQYNVMQFQEENVKEALRLNPQLQTIKIGSGFYSEFLRSLNKYLQIS